MVEQGEYHLADLPAEFANQSLVLRVVLTESLMVSGFFIRASEPAPYDPPGYVDESTFDEIELKVGVDPWVLPGVLTLPKGAGPFPAVVLVHGSGPNDRDEIIGGNRPFRDLAWGLASEGIAVLRYDKRTNVHGASIPLAASWLPGSEAEMGEVPDDQVVLGAPPPYWRELAEVNPVEDAKSVSSPFFVLQGGRDYQSTREDLAVWEEALGEKSDFSSKLYPDLSHVFVSGTGTATPEEYVSVVGHVAGEVISDIAEWILGMSR